MDQGPMEQSKKYTEECLNKFIDRVKKDSNGSVLIGSGLYFFFGFMFYMRHGGFTTMFFVWMIFPTLFYSFVYLYKAIFLNGKVANRVIKGIDFFENNAIITTISYSHYGITFKSKKISVPINKIRVQQGNYFLLFEEYKGSTLIIYVLGKKYYLFPKYFDVELIEKLLCLKK